MPRPEQVMAPLASVREPVVSWGSTSTVSKWKLGAQPWPMPDDTIKAGLGLEPAQFEVRLSRHPYAERLCARCVQEAVKGMAHAL